MDKTKSEYWLSQDSPFAKALAGFSPRESQIELAKAIEEAIADESILVAEAGTGIGKTFAYLIPALLCGKKIIVSTGTKTLQDQLYLRDIPTLRETMGLPAKISLLKGRSNYICLHRLENIDQQLFNSKAAIKDVQQIKRQVAKTRFGEISEISNVPDNSSAWYYVTSTVDNCLGSDCEYFDDCYLVKARRKAMTADMVVINHHLLFADIMLKEGDMGELLPDADLMVIDEAHQIPEVASQFMGERFSSRQVTELINDSISEQLAEAKEVMELQPICDCLNMGMTDLRIVMGESSTRAAWDSIDKASLATVLDYINKQFALLEQQLETMAGRSKGLESCWNRCQGLMALLQLVTKSGDNDFIHWYEVFSQSFSIYLTPLSIADEFSELLSESEQAWVFTSATLSVNGRFDLFAEQLGLSDARQLMLESPFPYHDNALLYVPKGLPDPNDADYTEAVVTAAIPVIEQNQGRTFFLFTSHRALRIASELLAQQLAFPLFVQGEMPKDQLLRDFVNHGNGVLLGTYSFWEGVDVRGTTLSCVIIDKLPFQSPDDPVSRARASVLRQQGKQPFRDYQLPKSVLSVKQGAGRLIRDNDDFGVVMICDPRIVARDYGRIFLASLPPMQRTRNEQTVLSFLEHMHEIPYETVND